MSDESHGVVVDAHAHLFTHSFFQALARQAGELLPPGDELQAIHERTGVEIATEPLEPLAARWVQEMDRNRIQRMVLMSSIPGDHRSSTAAARLHPNRIIPYAMFHPLEEGACDELRASAGEGLRGVCLFPAMHHLHADQDEVLEFISVAAELRLIVFVHFGLLRLGLRDKLGLPSPFDLRYSNPIELCRAAQQFPQVPFVIPHLGAGFFREVLLLASQCPNVHLDTSSSNSWVRTQPGRPSLGDVLHQALEVVGSLRLLFGSDSNVFPRGFRRDVLDSQIAIFRDRGISREEEVRIFGGNLLRLLETAA